MAPDALFSRGAVSDLIRDMKQRLVDVALALDPDLALATPVEDLVERLVHDFRFSSIELLLDERYTPGAQDAKIDVSQDTTRFIRDRSRPAYRAGTRLPLHIPFRGDAKLFNYFGSTRPMAHLQAAVHPHELVMSYEFPDDMIDPKQFADAMQRDIDLLNRFLRPMRAECEQFNEELPGLARAAVEKRRAKVLADRDLEESIGIEIRKRDDPSRILAVEVPKKRKRLTPSITSGARKAFKPEPTVSEEDYAEIVRAILAWGRAAERLPRSFFELGEESLRDNLLVSLNNTFGASGAEVFSRNGKTDVLIQVDDSSAVFIAECKIWTGAAALTEALEQLFGYLVWRDTKAALVIFIKNKNVTQVLERPRKP